jgi:hypothetical protein
MEKWEDLKVYRLLDPNDIPKEFKVLAENITENLAVYGFKIKQSKTIKQIFRISNDLVQSIFIQNTSPYTKNQKEIKISISIKPLFTDNLETPYYLFDVWKLNKAFKMGYVLSQHNSLLEKHLSDLFIKLLLPFLDNFLDSKSVCKNQKMIQEYEYGGSSVSDLIFECAFKNRDNKIFTPLINSRIEQTQKEFEYWKNNPKYSDLYKSRLDRNLYLLKAFNDDNIFDLEISKQKINEVNSLKKLNIKSASK